MPKWEYLRLYVYKGSDPDYSDISWHSLDFYLFGKPQDGPEYQYGSVAEAGLDGWELIKFDEYDSSQQTGLVFKREVVGQGPFKARAIDMPDISISDSIESLNLSVRSYNTLKRSGINTISEILDLPYKAFCRLQTAKTGSLDEIEKQLRIQGYAKLCPASHWVNISG